jgi:hypothetical protein
VDKKIVNTSYEAQILKVGVRANSHTPTWLSVYDAERPNTVFTHRSKKIRGYETFIVRLPLSAGVCAIEVGGTATIEKIQRLPLVRKLDMRDIANPDVRSFVEFFQRFAFNAGTMPLGTYKSDDGRYTIVYKDVIQYNNGAVSLSPMCIGEVSGIIEVAQRSVLKMTVAGRFALGCHEFAHVYMNEDSDSEEEADQNGLLLYLGLGYPRIEAYEVWLNTFLSVPDTPENERLYQLNKIRYDKMDKLITEFEKGNMLIYG